MNLLKTLVPVIDDTIIAMISAVIIFLLPTKNKKRRLLNWDEAVKLPWGILLLFGGGMALAAGFKDSGLALWIGTQMTLLDGISLILLVFILITNIFAIYPAEFVRNALDELIEKLNSSNSENLSLILLKYGGILQKNLIAVL